MKRQILFGVFCWLLLAGSQAFGAIAWVTASHTVCPSGTTNTNTVVCTMTVASGAGNDVHAGVQFKAGASVINFVTGAACSNAPVAWSSGTTYSAGQCAIATPSGSATCTTGCWLWRSTQSSNLNHAPGLSSTFWSPPQFFWVYQAVANGTNNLAALAICRRCSSIDHILVATQAATTWIIEAEEYSGVPGYGKPIFATGTSVNPAITITTSDANDWVMMSEAHLSSGGAVSANTGNLRDTARNGTNASNVGGSFCDSGAIASPGSFTCKVTISSVAWSAVGIEARTVAPPTANVLGSCSAGVPCVVWHDMRPYVATTENNNSYTFELPTQAIGSPMIIAIAWYDAVTITFLGDDNSDVFTSQTCQDAVGDTIKACLYTGTPTTGAKKITVVFSAPIAAANPWLHLTFTSVANSSGVVDGAISAQGLTAVPYQSGSFTPLTSGDFIYNFVITTYQFPESVNTMQPTVLPMDGFALGDVYLQDRVADQWMVQPSAAAINPEMYFWDFNGSRYISMALALKPATGTIPSGKVLPLRAHHSYNPGQSPTNNYRFEELPCNGNVQVVPSTQFFGTYPISLLSDSLGNVYTQITPTGYTTASSPQVWYASNTTCANDRVLMYAATNNSTHYNFLDLVGADPSSPLCTSQRTTGTQAALGTITAFAITSNVVTFTAGNSFSAGDIVTINGLTTGTYLNGQVLTVLAAGLSGTQFEANFTHANVGSTADSGFASPDITGAGLITAACRPGALAINTVSMGTGPPMSIFNPAQTDGVLLSAWADGMSDTSNWDSGDVYSIYSNSTGAGSLSFGFHMANTTAPTWDAISYEFNPPASTKHPRMFVVQQ